MCSLKLTLLIRCNNDLLYLISVNFHRNCHCYCNILLLFLHPTEGCEVGQWSEWGTCARRNKTCGFKWGLETRTRHIVKKPPKDTIPCPTIAESRRCKMAMRHCRKGERMCACTSAYVLLACLCLPYKLVFKTQIIHSICKSSISLDFQTKKEISLGPVCLHLTCFILSSFFLDQKSRPSNLKPSIWVFSVDWHFHS